MNLFERQMAEGALYAKTQQRAYKMNFARVGIDAMGDLAPNSYASISFGKQSICLAHMLYRVCPTMPMYFLASWESWIIHDFDDVIKDFVTRWPINLRVVQSDNVTDDPDRSWKETRDKGQHDLQNMCDREDWDGWYWGLVKEESKGRRMTLSWKWKGQPHPTIFKYKDGKYRCCPLMEWNNLDVAAYIQEHALPLLGIYKEHGLQMRTTARVTRNMAEFGGMAYLQRDAISKMNELSARFPELRAFT